MEKKFTELDVKEAIRMVLQDWNSSGGEIVTQKAIEDYYNWLLEKLNGEKV